jgi:catechol 2,3-dioxygenase-like lactoylglutathione lyase family enzyme
MTTLHHLAITAADFDTGREWYNAFLGALGYQPGHVGDTVCTWGGQQPEILLYPAEGVDLSPHTHGRPGWQHAAMLVADRDTVEAAHNAAKDVNGTVVHPPQEYDYMPGYYAVFVEDPFGVRWEVFHAPTLIPG